MADIAAFELPGDGLELDHAARYGHIERLVASWAEHRQPDGGAFTSAHLRHGFIQATADDQLAIEMRDEIACLQAGLVGRAAAEGRDDLDRAIFHHDRQAETGIIAVDHGLESLEIAAVQIARMRIERGQHPVDHAAHQLVVIDLVDVTRLDALVDRHHLGELRTRPAFDLRHARRGRGDQRDGSHEGGRT